MQLELIFDSDHPSKHQNNEVSLELVNWYEAKKKDLSSTSQSCALWFSYIDYIFILQEFICAERTNNWEAHIEITKSEFICCYRAQQLCKNCLFVYPIHQRVKIAATISLPPILAW